MQAVADLDHIQHESTTLAKFKPNYVKKITLSSSLSMLVLLLQIDLIFGGIIGTKLKLQSGTFSLTGGGIIFIFKSILIQ